MKKKTARRKKDPTMPGRSAPVPAASSLLHYEVDDTAAERQAAGQRDTEPDDFDSGTDVADDRVRGAGGQSLAELVITKEQGWGLDEHGGGIRFDQPEPNVNDYDPDSLTEEDIGDVREPKRSA